MRCLDAPSGAHWDDMETVLLLLGVLTMGAGLATLAVPMVPGLAIVYGGVLLVAWADGFARIGPIMLVVLLAVLLVGMVADNVAALFGARRAGASAWGVFGAGVGALLGLPLGILGVIVGPAVGALAFEYVRNPDLRRAGRAGMGGLLGFVLAASARAFFGVLIAALAALAYWF